MMKKLILVLMLIPIAYAFIAGDPIEFSIENCKEWVVIEVIPLTPLSNETPEYWISNGCDHMTENLWMCYCNGTSTKAVMQTSVRTVNSYQMTISYEYEVPHTGGSSGGGSRRRYIYVPNANATNVTKVITEIDTEECEVCDDGFEDKKPYLNITYTFEEEKVKQAVPNLNIGLWIILLIVLIILCGLLLYKWHPKNKR